MNVKLNKLARSILFLSLFWMLVSCQANSGQSVSTTTVSTATTTFSKPLPEKVATYTPTKPSSPSQTPLPSPTPISRLISADNALQVNAWKRIGKGTITNAPVYSPDGSLLAVPAATGIHLYDARTLEQVSALPLGLGTPEIAFSADGQMLALASYNVPVTIWDLSSSTMVQELESPTLEDGYWLYDLHFSPDGTRVAATSGGEYDRFWVWSAETGELLYDIEGGFAGSFSPDWTWMVVKRWVQINDISKGHVYLYQLSDGAQLNEWEADKALFSPDGYLAIEAQGSTRLIDLKTNTVMPTFRGTQAAFSADGSKMALFRDRVILIYDLETGGPLLALEGSYGVVENLLFSPDGTTIAGYSDEMEPSCCQGGTDTVSLWNASDGSLITSLKPEEYMPWITFSPDGGSLVVSDINQVRFLAIEDGLSQGVLEYDLPAGVVVFSVDGDALLLTRGSAVTNAEIRGLPGGELLRRFENVGENDWENEASFSPDGNLLAVRGNFWDLAQGRRMDELDKINAAFTYPPLHDAFSVDNNTLALGFYDGQAALWDFQNNELIRNLDGSQLGYTGETVSLAFSPDGSILAVAYGFPDFVVQFWGIPRGEPLISMRGYSFRRLLFSADGAYLLTLADVDDDTVSGGLQIWRVADGELLSSIAPHRATSASISPDGSLIVTGATDGMLRLWRLSDGELLNQFPGHNNWIYGLDFSPDGELIASSAMDGTIVLWSIPEQ